MNDLKSGWGALALLVLSCQQAPDASPEGKAAPESVAVLSARPAAGTLKSDGLEKLSALQLAERVMKVTQADQMADQMMAAMAPQLKLLPKGEKILAAMTKEIPTMMKKVLPIYAKHYSSEEMIELIRFYESTTGKAVIAKMPLVMQESMQISQAWAQEVMAKLLPKPPGPKIR